MQKLKVEWSGMTSHDTLGLWVHQDGELLVGDVPECKPCISSASRHNSVQQHMRVQLLSHGCC